MYCHFMQDELPPTERGIFLAGDDVSWTPGWVEGAVTTGLNAVWGIINHLGGTLPSRQSGPGRPLRGAGAGGAAGLSTASRSPYACGIDNVSAPPHIRGGPEGLPSDHRMTTLLDFEKPILELEGKVKELRLLSDGGELDIADEVGRLEGRASKLLSQTYAKLTAWQKTQVARHADRPHFKDYAEALIEDFTPLAGDRLYGEDRAIVGGLGRFRGLAVMVIGHEKGADTEDRVRHNFGMARPEGYRKAVRLMRLAERFRLPVLTFVDTPGAHPGIDAEERGQAEAIARAIEVCLSLEVPLVATIVGEGGSGGAIALAAADRILMLEHSIYSVISPEGCAAILWRANDQAPTAAEALKLTAQDLFGHRLVDQVIPEPLGGAHRGRATTIAAVGDAIEQQLRPLLRLSGAELKRSRRDKFLRMGQPPEPKAATPAA